MLSIDPVWLAMVLGAQARLQPTSYVANHRGDPDPRMAYFHLKEAIRKQGPIDVDILDNGPGSEERRKLLAESLRQHAVDNNPQVRQWVQTVLESTLQQSPRTITAAGFDAEDVRGALQSLEI